MNQPVSKNRYNRNRIVNSRGRNHVLGGFTALAGLGLGLASYAAFHEPLRVRLERLTLRVPNASGRLPARGLRILHLTDTHFRGANWRERPKMEQVCRICSGMDYDILVHTGDFLHNDRGLANTVQLLEALPKPRLGAYAVLGNHDYTLYSAKEMFGRSWRNFQQLEESQRQNGNGAHNGSYAASRNGAGPIDRMNRFIEFGRYFANAPLDLRRTGFNDTTALARELASRNVRLLQNEHVRLEHRTGPHDTVDLYIAGVDDLTEGAPDLERALTDVPPAAPTLLLSHNPDIVGAAGIERADVVLSGHTHGGQIVLPWLGPAHTHSEQLTRREASGYLRRGPTQVYISRGVGEGIPLRFAAAPQIALVTLVSD